MTDRERVEECRKQFLSQRDIHRKTGLSLKRISDLVEEIEEERQETFLKETGKLYDPNECMELYRKFYEIGKSKEMEARKRNAIVQTARYLRLPEREVNAFITNKKPVFRTVNLSGKDINDIRKQFSFLKKGVKIRLKQSYTHTDGFHTRVESGWVSGVYKFGILVLLEGKKQEFFSFSGLYADKLEIELVTECGKRIS